MMDYNEVNNVVAISNDVISRIISYNWKNRFNKKMEKLLKDSCPFEHDEKVKIYNECVLGFVDTKTPEHILEQTVLL